MKDTHQVLKQILVEKEAAVKRLEREIESIHVVLGLLGDTELLGMIGISPETTPTPAPQPMHAENEPTGRVINALPAQNRIPPIAAPFSASGNTAQPSSPIDGRKSATHNWP